jgi:hypothetical protein
MSHIYVNHIAFEYEESSSFHDILVNSGSGTQSLLEETISNSHIYVNCINIEVPKVGQETLNTLTNLGTATHTLEESIAGTPIPEEEVVVQTGGVSSTAQFFGGNPFLKEILTTVASNESEIQEATHVVEEVIHRSTTLNAVVAKVRKPVFKPIKTVEILPYTIKADNNVVIDYATPEFTSRTKKEEEELILLGII